MVNDLIYNPNYAVPPGETLLDTLEELNMTQAELAKRMNRPTKTINEIIKGKAEITPTTALELEMTTGVPAQLWNNLERNYRTQLASIKERESFIEQIDFLDAIPVKEMIKRGWIQKYKDSVDQLVEVLKFYRLSTVEAWDAIWGNELADNVAFRKALTYESDKGAISAWLRQGEIEAEKIICQPFDKQKFRFLLQNDVRELTTESNPEVFLPKLIKLCSDVGVAVVLIKELPKCRVNGATYWVSSDKAVIQLSARYKSDDHLWFTFFHEAGHIVLHGKKETFLETGNKTEEEVLKEQEADKFASETLIPSNLYNKFSLRRIFISHQTVTDFAEEIGIAPGIVVGRLQHDGMIPYTHLNKLKIRYTWAD
ncbi:XRE family plasmid maintenance system antidote protein [Actinobacillus pleuropneumoniae]|nr:XRE family plasmid maintenance system antidote protein [Actinobacillus pleuropneumoniae]